MVLFALSRLVEALEQFKLLIIEPGQPTNPALLDLDEVGFRVELPHHG
jgi:hypothetical protein